MLIRSAWLYSQQRNGKTFGMRDDKLAWNFPLELCKCSVQTVDRLVFTHVCLFCFNSRFESHMRANMTSYHLPFLCNPFFSLCSSLFQRNVCRGTGVAVTSVQWSPAKGWCVPVPMDSIWALTTARARRWTSAQSTWSVVRYASNIKPLLSVPVIPAGHSIQMEKAAVASVLQYHKLDTVDIWYLKELPRKRILFYMEKQM